MDRTKQLCPACGIASLRQAFNATPLDYSLKERFDILVCERCGHGITMTESAQHEMPLHEGGSYDTSEKLWHRLASPFLRLLERNKMKYLGPKPEGARLLEVGCGKGRFLEVAVDAGYSVHGLEPSKRSYSFARTRLGDKVLCMNLEDLGEEVGQFDFIVLWHVLEHINDIDAVLDKIKTLLYPAGKVLIAVPNFKSFQARIGRSNWYGLDPPRHLHHFSPQSIEKILKRHNLRIERFFFNSFYLDYVGELITYLNVILPDKNVIPNILKYNHNYFNAVGWRRALFMSAIAPLIMFLLAIPGLLSNLLARMTGHSGSMVALVTLENAPGDSTGCQNGQT